LLIALLSGITDDSWTPRSAFAANILQDETLVKVYEENLASFRYEVGKGKNTLAAFIVNCEHRSLTVD
jgi:hypothetical protein